MTSQRDAPTARRIQGQGRILEELAEGDAPLTATLDRLEKRFGLTQDELRICLLELAYAGWITIHIQPFGRVTIQLEQGDGTRPVTVAGNRSVPQVWRLGEIQVR
jgi:hypothetical protein